MPPEIITILDALDSRQENTTWISDLRIVACLLVIVVHVALYWLTASFNAAMVYGSFARCCVPQFLMISGALSVAPVHDLRAFTSKWLKRLVIPLLAWSIIFECVLISEGHHSYDTVLDFFPRFLGQKISYHFWYVYMIIGVYLLLPVLSAWITFTNGSQVKYFLLIWFIWQILQVPVLEPVRPDMDITVFASYVGYVVLGYAIRFSIIRITLSLSVALMVAGFGLTLFMTWYSSQSAGKFVHTWYDYLRPNVIILSAGVFSFMKSARLFGERTEHFRSSLASYAFGIYLVHLLFTERLTFFQSYNAWYAIPATTLVCFLFSFIVIWLIDKVPGLRVIAARSRRG